MSKNKVPENETKEEKVQRKQREAINSFVSKSEKVAWSRLEEKMQSYIDELEPIEDNIHKLQSKRNVILDDVITLRKKMVESCIHPLNRLVHHEDYIVCKFCETKLSIPKKRMTSNGIKDI